MIGLTGLLVPVGPGGTGPVLAMVMAAAMVAVAWRVLRLVVRIALLVTVVVIVLHVLGGAPALL